jgi:hypothetical protein
MMRPSPFSLFVSTATRLVGASEQLQRAGQSSLRPAVTTSESALVQTLLLNTCQPVAASGHAAEDGALSEAALEV